MNCASSAALVVFAKAPQPGLAKTRLIPALGLEGAAALAQKMLEHTVHVATQAGFEHLELCTAPDTRHAAFQDLRNRYPIALTPQGEGDLGARLQGAFARHLRQHAQVVIVGTDAPALTPAMLHQASAALQDHDAVFVPAFDGGYALIGLSRPAPTLFDAMPWSTAQLMHATRERARAAGLSWAELAPVADIDTPADLVRLPATWIA